MKFKIRNIDAAAGDEYEICQSAYFKHLEAFNKTVNTDLWKFFTRDFFHDGRIHSINFRPDLKTASITMDCPNIKSVQSKGIFKYMTATFSCTFSNVIRFAMEDTRPTGIFVLKEEPLIFLASEINTCIPDSPPGEGTFYSLLIETMSGDQTVWIEIVFSQVEVAPLEKLAFALIESDPRYEVPVYQPDEEK